MSDEPALLAAIAAAPADALPRLVYADYLDDHNRPADAELVRLEVALAGGGGTDQDRWWFRTLAAARDPAWLAKVVRPEVGRCGLRFRFACPKRWADMTPTTDPTQRHCEACNRTVHLCTTRAQAANWAAWGECVAVDRRLVPLGDLRPAAGTETVTSGLIDFDYRPPERLPPEEPMGVELRYAAVSPAWGLVELARADRDHGDSLAMLPTWLAGRLAPERAGERADPIWQAVCRHADAVPRVFDLDRRFDFLHWLLSATRRGEAAGWDDGRLDRLFGTGSPVADHVRASQGRPVVWVPAGVVTEAAAVLATFTPAELARRFDPARAGAAGIYKYFAGRDDADWLATAGEQLVGLQQFLSAAAARGDELIVVVD